jgi:hypothetical protein
MTDTWWWKSLIYLVMSLVVAWHSAAIMLSPLPENSGALRWARSYLNPYLALFRLDNRWSFFAPEVGKQRVFRYIVEDAEGKEHTFEPLNEHSWSFPRYVLWRQFKYLYDSIMSDPEAYVPVVALLCRQHASLKPVAVSFVQVQELDFWAEDYLKGHRPLQPDYVQVIRLTNTSC